MQYKTKGEKIFSVFNYLLLTFIGLTCLIPLLNILALSLSSKAAIGANKVTLFPVDFSLAAYKYALGNPKLLRALMISVIRVILGVGISLTVTILMAYPLSKDKNVFAKRNLYANIVLAHMLIGGGTVPMYILLTNLHLLDTIWALVLPGAVASYNIILTQNFFRSIPKELEEAAFVDGAGSWRALFSIVIPLSKPVLATVTLFIAVSQWNSWFDGMIYMNSARNYPLQTYLQTLIVTDEMMANASVDLMEQLMEVTSRNLTSAQIFIALVPIMVIYPMLQKHFTKGIMLGSVKG